MLLHPPLGTRDTVLPREECVCVCVCLCLCVGVCVNVCEPRMLPLLTQQLLLLTPSILKVPTRRVPPHTSDWLPPPPLIDPCQLACRPSELPLMRLRVHWRSRDPCFLFLSFPLSPPVSPSVWTVTRLGSESSAGGGGVEPEWRLYCCTVMPLSSVAAVSLGD